MKKVCNDFKLKKERVERWSKQDENVFKRWVFSECGAVMARKRGDPVQPWFGLGEQEGNEKVF